ncbi:MAG: RuBisCO large subunit C-terminal-like domain-containing protein [Casimicrobiaceae bacterium]
MATRFVATYRIACPAEAVEARAQALALEQSVELPDGAVRDARVRAEVMGRAAAIRAVGDRLFDADIELAEETVGADAGQLMNMLFGNASLQGDVTLVDVQIGDRFAAAFGGPRFGIEGVRARTARARPLSCAALKPQGLGSESLAALAGSFAAAGIDIIKDDHGLADQASAPFAARVPACQRAIDAIAMKSGHRALYAPSLTGSLDAMRRQLDHARACGVGMAMVAPMVSGVSNLGALAAEAGMPLLAHPALSGAARIAPALLLGKLFRLFGADATIFPHAGGRFGYTLGECVAIADAARAPWHGLDATMPVPAGGMTVERVPHLRELYGDDAILLIGGSLLAGDDLDARCRAFVAAVATPCP